MIGVQKASQSQYHAKFQYDSNCMSHNHYNHRTPIERTSDMSYITKYLIHGNHVLFMTPQQLFPEQMCIFLIPFTVPRCSNPCGKLGEQKNLFLFSACLHRILILG